MEAKINNNKKALVLAAAASVILAILFGVSTVSTRAVNANLKAELRSEKLKQDSILSTKILLDKEIAGLLKDIDGQKANNSKLAGLLNDANTELNNKIAELGRIKKENLTVKKLKKELNDVKEIRERLNRDIADLTAENLMLKNEVKGLKDELAIMAARPKEPLVLPTAGNFMVEMLKRNDKLTVKSRRTKSFQLSFDIAGLEQLSGEEEFYVSLTDPSGNELEPAAEDLLVKGTSIKYSSKIKVNTGSEKEVNQKIKLGDKIKLKGVYCVKVYNAKHGLIGSAKVKAM